MTDHSYSGDSLSLSASLSKNSLEEEMSLTGAFIEEALRRQENTITNEEIRPGDRILDTYEVRSEAVSGGMGSVWKVRHEGWAVDLAMKRPQPRFFAEGSQKRKEEFVRECENWIDLGLHPNIVSCYYVREIGGVPTIFSEWMDGGSLRERMKDGTLYEGTEQRVQRRILDIAIQAARGLRYSHENHLIHQDMKPGNLLLTKDWEAKVADFGLAKAREKLERASGTAAISTGGTLAYCPKEQAEGGEAQEWMDTYAWALTVLEMYAGERFWSTGAEAFSILFEGDSAGSGGPEEAGDSAGPGRPRWRITPPEEFLAALRDDWCKGSSRWRDLAAMEELLTGIYRKLTGIEYFRESFNAASHTADSLNNMALSYLDLGKHKEAETLWEKAAGMEQGHPDTMYNRALYRWMMGQETDLYLLDEIDRITDPQRRLELHRKAAIVRREVPDAAASESYMPPVSREDWTEQNSVRVGESNPMYSKGSSCDWVLGRDDAAAQKPSRLFRVPHDRENPEQEGGPSRLFLVHGIPSPSADESVVVFCTFDRLCVYSVPDTSMILTKKFRKDSILSYCGGAGAGSCYLGCRDGLYEYFFETEEMRRILPSDCGIYNIKLRCGGKTLISCDRQNRLTVMDRLSGEVVFTIPTPLPSNHRFDWWGDESGIFEVSEQDTVLFFSLYDHLYRYSLADGSLLSEETAGDPECRVLDYRGPFCLTGSHNYCQIWDTRSGLCLRSYRARSLSWAGFLEGTSDGEEELSGFFLKSFPGIYRHFRLTTAPPEPVWSLCRIRTTSEQTEQDQQFEEHIREAKGALERGEYGKAYAELSKARDLPNRKNAPECLQMYDALYPRFERGKLTDCTVLYDFGSKAFEDTVPVVGPDGSWLFKDVFRGEKEVLSAEDGRCLRRFPVAEDFCLSCANTRLTCLVKRGNRKGWAVEVCALPGGVCLLSREFTAGKASLDRIWTQEDREVIAVMVSGIFGGKVLMYIDPQDGKLIGKGQVKPDPAIEAAHKNGMPFFFRREKLSDGTTAFLYDQMGSQTGRYACLDLYGEEGRFLRRYEFKRPNQASSDDIIRPVLLPQGYLAGERGNALILFRTSDFAGNGEPAGQPLPLPAPFGRTAMSEDARYLFNNGRVCRLEWELLSLR